MGGRNRRVTRRNYEDKMINPNDTEKLYTVYINGNVEIHTREYDFDGLENEAVTVAVDKAYDYLYDQGLNIDIDVDSNFQNWSGGIHRQFGFTNIDNILCVWGEIPKALEKILEETALIFQETLGEFIK
jgi:hypothetical protein